MRDRSPHPLLLTALCWLTLGQPALARADEAPTPDPAERVDLPSSVVPPKALSTEVEVPVEPTSTIQILLELVINEQGTVDDALVVSGPEPFAAAALSASDHFTFEPARVRGKIVASKIRFLVRFEPKQLESVSATTKPRNEASAPSRRPVSDAARATTATEVVVVGVRPAYTTSTVTRAEAREIPGTFGDPLRAVESSPGITPIFSGVPFFFVRGAPPGNTGFFLDGVKVPLLYHAVLGPSVIHPALIDHVDLYRGAPSAKFGRYAGAVINAETRPGLSRLGGEANVRVFDAGGLVETPVANGKGHVLLGGRYSYTALAASLLSGADLEYWDYQTRADMATGDYSQLGLFAFGAYDHAAVSYDSEQQGGGMQFHRIDLRHDIQTDRLNSRVALTVGYDKTDSTSGELRDKSLSFRSLNEYRLTRNTSIAIGGDVGVDAYQLSIDETTAEADDIQALFPARSDVIGGVFAEVTMRPTAWATVAPGLRADVFRINKKTASSLDPRLSATFTPHPNVYTAYTVGLMHQAPNFVPQVPAAQVGTLEGGLQRSLSTSSTVGVRLPLDLSASATGFRVAFFDLLDPIGRNRDLSFDPNNLRHRERGSSMGLELELRRNMTRRIGGFLGVTISRTERSSGRRESLSAFDRPVVLQGAVSVDLGRNFRAGAKAVYYSGIPALEVVSGRESYYSGNRRADDYFRADLRLEKRWPIAGRGYWAIVAEMLNATMSREITSRRCSPSTCQQEVSGPLAIPSIGVELYSY